MRNLLFYMAVLSAVALMACSARLENDGSAVSARIIKSQVMDSVGIAQAVSSLDTLITPEIFGRDFGKVTVEVLESDTVIDAVQLNRRVSLLRSVYAQQRGGGYGKRFAEGVQSYIDGLPIERRMRLYTRIATPKQMGTALRIDLMRGKTDTALSAEQLRQLKLIYSAEEWTQFEEYYNRK